MDDPCTLTITNEENHILRITVVEKFPEKNALGGYVFCGQLKIMIPGWQLEENNFYFSSQQLDLFLQALKPLCCLKGTARYVPELDDTRLFITIRRHENGSFNVAITYHSFSVPFLEVTTGFDTTLPYIENLIADLQHFWRLYVQEEPLDGKKATILISEPWECSGELTGKIISQIDSSSALFEANEPYNFGEYKGTRFELNARYEKEIIKGPGEYTVNGALLDNGSKIPVFIGSVQIEK